MISIEFIKNFNRRLNEYTKNDISEDSMRYDLYSAFLLSGLKSEKIQLEYTHDNPSLAKREVDVVIHTKNSKIALELKYFKTIPSKKNDTTSQMGKFIVDLLKLKHLSKNIKARYFLFITDEKMFNYIKNTNNGFSKLDTSFRGEKFRISANDKKGKHYTSEVTSVIPNELKPFETDISLKKITYHKISNNHYVGCFRVLS